MKYLTGVKCTACLAQGRYGEVTVEVLFFDAQGKQVEPKDRYTRMQATGLIQCSNHLCLAPYTEVPGKPFAVNEVLFTIKYEHAPRNREWQEADRLLALRRKNQVPIGTHTK